MALPTIRKGKRDLAADADALQVPAQTQKQDVDDASMLRSSIRRYSTMGMLVVGFLFFGVGGWAVFANVHNAVIAPGRLVVASSVQEIQHREGGIVAEILVKNGDRVKAGDALLRLADPESKARYAILDGQLVDQRSRLARLEAEQFDQTSISFPQDLLARQREPDVASALNNQIKLFEARRRTQQGLVNTLTEQVIQLEDRVGALQAQQQGTRDELVYLRDEMAGIEQLYEQGHARKTQLMALKRAEARTNGSLGSLTSQISMTKANIAEVRQNILQQQRDFQAQVATELAATKTEIVTLREQLIAASDRLRRIDLVAPRDGVVHNLTAKTVGGVIRPGETVMELVPEDQELLVDAQVSPADRDQVHPGQGATVIITAFSYRDSPRLEGVLETVSPEVIHDETGRMPDYYKVQIRLKEGERNKLGERLIAPGMPADAFIKTVERSIISYLLSPLSANFERAFRHE